MGKLINLVGTGIGIAREASIARQGARSASTPPSNTEARNDYSNDYRGSDRYPEDNQNQGYIQDEESNQRQWSNPYQEGKVGNLTQEKFTKDGMLLAIEEDDEADWQSDEAQRENSPPESYSNDGNATVTGVVQSFAHNHPPPSYEATEGRLSNPVIIPQRRPEKKGRGFISAYAPALMVCGIDQATFLDFLDSFNAACKVSPIFDAVNIAAFAAGFAPAISAQIVSIATTVAVKKAKSVQVDRQTNNFLEKMNEILFKPHGLFCTIMTFQPDQESASIPVNMAKNLFSSTGSSKSNSKPRSGRKTYGELQMPKASPLIFPGPGTQPSTDVQQSSFSRFREFSSDYLDKRAQAKYSSTNPTSSLNMGPGPHFNSRFSDPNSAAYSGRLISLATGGLLSVKQRGGLGRGPRRGGQSKTSLLGGLKEIAGGKQEEGLIGGAVNQGKSMVGGVVKRTLGQNVLYLMIVNMPTEGEMAAIVDTSMQQSPQQEYERQPPQQQYRQQQSQQPEYMQDQPQQGHMHQQNLQKERC